MRRGLSHPEPTVQQKAHCLTHHSLGCICSTHGSFRSLPNYSFYSWGQSPTAWVSHAAPLWTVCSEKCCSVFPKTQLQQAAVVWSYLEVQKYLISAASSSAAAHSKVTLTEVSSFQVLAWSWQQHPEHCTAGENGQVWECFVWDQITKKSILVFCLSAIIKNPPQNSFTIYYKPSIKHNILVKILEQL